MRTKQFLKRQVFELSRECEFFTEKELEMQIGHSKPFWYVALIKELVDNALDACEVDSILPEIHVNTTDEYFEVSDNGPGLRLETLVGSLNYLVRVSDKQFYVSPTRGQMGNALKTVWAAPYVALGHGKVEVEACGIKHTVETSLDRLTQKPEIARSEDESLVTTGTLVRIYWPQSSRREEEETSYSYKGQPPSVGQLVQAYAAFNPHAKFVHDGLLYPPTNPAWKKWRTDTPTSPHWYTAYTLRDLIAAYVVAERSNGGRHKTVREFVSEFKGLSATAKQKKVTEGFKATHLSDLVVDGDVKMKTVERLLSAMKAASTPVKPYSLGLVGEEHLKAWVSGCGIIEQSFRYRKVANAPEDCDQLPYALEVAFAVKKNTEEERTLVTGMNWSPTLGVPADEMSDAIQKCRIDPQDPVVLVIHLIRPRFEYMDRGKTRIAA